MGAARYAPFVTAPSGVDPLLAMPAAELAAGVNAGRISAQNVIHASLARIEALREGNAFITVTADEALTKARQNPRGPLAGVPLAVKDIFDTAGIRTTAGSKILRDRVPRRTAPAVARLEAAGAIVVGKTNMHEFAWGVTSENPHWGWVANPALPGHVAGGSSGGTAAALASYQATIGLGTDTGGSIRIPSACCGTVGFKPAWGREGGASTQGVFPLAPSYDTAGPMARTVADTLLVESILTGRLAPNPNARLRIGVLAPTPEAEAALAALGARLEPAELPPLDPDLMAVFSAECAMTHALWWPTRRDEYGADLQAKLEAAQSITAVQWRRGLAAIRALRRQARALPFDLLLSPTLAIEPPASGTFEPDVRTGMTRWTRPFNFLRWPAIAIGGIQLAGPSREMVLGAALALEQAGLVARPGN
jgi:Asp-tRNA(Asn)/Glu-tRNA(Gln) amidotransferase A subunit family amidase